MMALSIDGESIIRNADPIKRAHPNFVEKLNALGANIKWEKG
jgi:UDP-N-acetylglucosamine 1-carboxyvinyltransferase